MSGTFSIDSLVFLKTVLLTRRVYLTGSLGHPPTPDLPISTHNPTHLPRFPHSPPTGENCSSAFVVDVVAPSGASGGAILVADRLAPSAPVQNAKQQWDSSSLSMHMVLDDTIGVVYNRGSEDMWQV